MNKIQKYEAVRKLSNKEFNTFKEVYKFAKRNTFEKLETIVLYLMVIALGYVSYETKDLSNNYACLISGISAGTLLLGPFVGLLISSVIAVHTAAKKKNLEQYISELRNILSKINK